MSNQNRPQPTRLDGRVCLLTGATAGIGRASALRLAELGAELIVVGRNAGKLDDVRRDIQRVAPSAQITCLEADLSSLVEVRRLAARVLEVAPLLHVLVNNAGVATRRRHETVDGIELQLAVNHLTPFLLTNLLLPRLVASAPSRVVTVASQVERHGAINFDDLQGRGAYDGNTAYRQSKLANILFTRELARRNPSSGVTPISVHPGVYTTKLIHDLKGWSRIVTRLRGRGLPGPEEAGSVIAHAVAAPDWASRPGLHLHEFSPAEPSDRARDESTARRLWLESERLVGL
jgi:NAD(P)-dependent dehydrogenase (short-subunit alcohol dehydrogenase family)